LNLFQHKCKNISRDIIFIPMEITLKLLGGRLKEMRKALDMLQEDVAKHLDVNQNAISRIENGAGGGINVLLKLLNFYSDFFVVEHILSPKFEVVRRSETTGPLESVAIERLRLLKTELVEEIENINLLLSSK
jgi:transcriptional regulator with XRE-family HTH domain